MIGSKTVEQVTDEDSIPRRIGPHHPGQAAELGIDIFDFGRLGLSGELGFPRKGAVKGDKVEIGKVGGRRRQVLGVSRGDLSPWSLTESKRRWAHAAALRVDSAGTPVAG